MFDPILYLGIIFVAFLLLRIILNQFGKNEEEESNVVGRQENFLHNQFLEFTTEPTKEKYLELCHKLSDSEYYSPYSRENDEAKKYYTQTNDSFLAVKMAENAMPNHLLSPYAHTILSYLYQENGEQEMSKMESMFATACFQGILETGDGTEDRPFIVMRISDEYDILDYLKKGMSKQFLIQRNGKEYDKIECRDGTELWFDITIPKNCMTKTTS